MFVATSSLLDEGMVIVSCHGNTSKTSLEDGGSTYDVVGSVDGSKGKRISVMKL